MAFGLQTFTPSGNIILDTSVHRLPKFVASGSANVPSAGGTVNVTISGMTNDGTWLVFTSKLAQHYWVSSINSGSFTIKSSTNVTGNAVAISYQVYKY